MGESGLLPSRRQLLSLGLGVVGLYLLVAVVAYFVSYPLDLPALEGAPSATPLNNPTGWIGAQIAHRLVYRGFGWVGILFPLALLYASLQWSRRKPVRLKVLAWGLVALYAFSTLGGWLAQIGAVEDLIWCGSVGAGLAAWVSLYIGPVGLFLGWVLLASAAVWALWTSNRPPKPPEETDSSLESSPPTLERSPQEEPPPQDEPSWYEVVPLAPPQTPWPADSSLELSVSEAAKPIAGPVSASVAELPPDKPYTPLSPEKSPLSTDVSRQPEFSIESPLSFPPEAPAEPPLQTQPKKLQPVSADEVSTQPFRSAGGFEPPPLVLLDPPLDTQPILPRSEIEAHKDQIVQTLQHYGIPITRITATVGPTVTLFEIVPAPGIRISKIKSLEDDIALSLAALGIRIIAPMPGKGTIGIEVPHAHPRMVPLRELLSSKAFQESGAALPLALGKTITNETFVRDLAQMPHLLIAGATGQGKSVALNCMLLSLLYKRSPDEVRFLLIDPKKVEMSLYQGLEHHYLAKVPGIPEPIITDVKHALPALQSLVLEMEMRYELLKEAQARNLPEYNARCREGRLPEGHRPLPYLVLIMDELADLMMTAGKEVETPICRLAQLARAVGIHLIVATQRPSVNVITGLIKANFPVRISFRVVTKVDSRVILDTDGAERLIGRGDMLFLMGTELLRLQSGYVSSAEIERVLEHLTQQPPPAPYVLPEPPNPEKEEASDEELTGERDPLFYEAALLVVRSRYGSTSLLQRKLGIGFNRAGRLMDQLERAGIVGPARGSKPRDVLLQDESELQAYL
ncbi:MAG: DNA translocase FtsK [Bacteroidetes bacterium]|nr:MAG: DNA translocase FtsK [Bacteroidota bacterium]